MTKRGFNTKKNQQCQDSSWVNTPKILTNHSGDPKHYGGFSQQESLGDGET